MSKKYLLISIGIIVIVVFSICIKCGKNDLPTTSMMDAERILQEYLKSANQWEEEYSLEPTDPVVGEIDNNDTVIVYQNGSMTRKIIDRKVGGV